MGWHHLLPNEILGVSNRKPRSHPPRDARGSPETFDVMLRKWLRATGQSITSMCRAGIAAGARPRSFEFGDSKNCPVALLLNVHFDQGNGWRAERGRRDLHSTGTD